MKEAFTSDKLAYIDFFLLEITIFIDNRMTRNHVKSH